MRLTKNQRQALEIWEREQENIRMHIPPECGGQIVEVSYGAADGVIFRREFDHGDGRELVAAYRFPADPDAPYEPWNGAPSLGRRIGVIVDVRS